MCTFSISLFVWYWVWNAGNFQVSHTNTQTVYLAHERRFFFFPTSVKRLHNSFMLLCPICFRWSNFIYVFHAVFLFHFFTVCLASIHRCVAWAFRKKTKIFFFYRQFFCDSFSGRHIVGRNQQSNTQHRRKTTKKKYSNKYKRTISKIIPSWAVVKNDWKYFD